MKSIDTKRHKIATKIRKSAKIGDRPRLFSEKGAAIRRSVRVPEINHKK
jgi:hypothetical protein